MATVGQKEIRNDYQDQEGIGEEQNLIPEEADLTLQRNRVGLQ